MVGLVDGNNFYVSCERVIDRTLVGKPVAVLSNNDGCCVAMSPEFKALGIPRGTPYFQLKDREQALGLKFFSSNYELYGDISRRVLMCLREESIEVEQYSIDEAFIYPPTTVLDDLIAYGGRLRQKVLEWVGIPCGVGFASTKTLAKIANHIGKKRAGGVFVMPDDPTPILEELPVEEVWGVGHRLGIRLHGCGVHTAEQFRQMDDADIRRIASVVAVRTAMELRGIPCVGERDYDADPDSVSCSRSFGTPVTTRDDLVESLANFTAQAAVKLRQHGQVASGCNIYAQIGTACQNEFVGRTVAFPVPTDATNEMLRTIRPEAEALFVPGTRYRKSGVVFFGLEKAGISRQQDLFSPTVITQSSKLYKAIDALNAKLGKGTVRTGAEGLYKESVSSRKGSLDTVKAPDWIMKREKLSQRATTRWDELICVR